MKRKIFPAALAALMICLTACGEEKPAPAIDSVDPARTTAAVSETAPETTAAVSETEVQTTTAAETEETVSSETAPAESAPSEEKQVAFFDGSVTSYNSFVVMESGSYRFEHSGDDDEHWSVYVLDEAFDDAIRYLFSNYEPQAESNAELELKKGQCVYCLCSVNEWNSASLADCDLTVTLIRSSEDEDEPAE